MKKSKYLSKVSPVLLIVVTVAVLIGFGLYKVTSPKSSPAVPAPAAKLSLEEFSYESEKLDELVKSGTPKDAIDYLEENIPSNPSLARDCHPLLHGAGHAAFEKYGSFSSAMKYQNELCNSGYTHGVIEAQFNNTKDVTSLLPTICNIEGQTKYQEWQCFHGVGHGVMIFSKKDTVKSTDLCSKLPSKFAVDSCRNGVFMERFVIIDHAGNITAKLPTDLSVCESQSPDNKTDCYVYIPSAYLTLHQNAYQDALDWCKDAGNYYSTCIRGVGSQVMKENITNPDIALNVCSSAPREVRSVCVQGAISLLVVNDGSTKNAEDLCQNQFRKYSKDCQAQVNSLKTLLTI